MYIQRKIEATILKYLSKPEIIAIVGSRQCGKTTTLQNIYKSLPDAIFLTFEDREILSLFETDIKQFIQTYINDKKYVFIDEFQYAKNGGKLLKYIYDTTDTKLVISGSSAIDLTIKTLKFLVGRVLIFNMFPLDFAEYLQYKDKNFAQLYEKEKINLKKLNSYQENTLAPEQKKILKNYYEEYVVWGGYPRVVTSTSPEEKTEILKNIYSTYFLREVKGILGLIDDFKLTKLIKALALQIGNLIEYGELSQTSELSFTTVKKYLNFLSKTYIGELVRPFYKNKRTEIVKNQKIYFYDTGLRNIIINDFRGFAGRTDSGTLLENSLWMQLTKNGYPTQYWRDKNQNEIDFIVDLGEGKNLAIEVKYQANKCAKAPVTFTAAYEKIDTVCAYFEEHHSHDKQIFLPLV